MGRGQRAMEAGNAEEACCFLLCTGLKALLFSHLLLAFFFVPSILLRLSSSHWTDGQTEAQGGSDLAKIIANKDTPDYQNPGLRKNMCF